MRAHSSESDPERNVVFLTINAPELDPDFSLTVDGTKLAFKGHTHKVSSQGSASTIEPKDYEFELELFDSVDEKKRALTGKSLQVVLQKQKAQQEYWPRLVKDKGRNNRIKSNFDLWRDEDEQEDDADDAVRLPFFHPTGSADDAGGGRAWPLLLHPAPFGGCEGKD